MVKIKKRGPGTAFTAGAVFFLAAFSALFFPGCRGKKAGPVVYEFTTVLLGTLERTVSASGTINPVSTVNVLPRMSGKVEVIHVDYNDAVRKGDILAELNTDMLKLQREQQNASVIKAKANYELQEINYRNQLSLAEKNLISEYELKTSKTTLDNQAADLAVAEANLKAIETEINQYAYITSPIDGIVLDRNINVGDTVVDSSSNNSSKIFTLAENLREMQIEAVVGELDVTSIRREQAVNFTLESLPGRAFTGEVETLRMVPVVSNNVVSYTVIIKVENDDGSLLPGMTCAVDFVVERSENTLMVSNAALRYEPTSLGAEQIEEMVFTAGLAGMTGEEKKAAQEARELAKSASQGQSAAAANTGLTGLMMGGAPRGRQFFGTPRRQRREAGGAEPAAAVVMRNLWFLGAEGKLNVMRVQTGISDGSFTAIVSGENLEGKEVILREKI